MGRHVLTCEQTALLGKPSVSAALSGPGTTGSRETGSEELLRRLWSQLAPRLNLQAKELRVGEPA